MGKLTKLCGKLKETVELGEGDDKIILELKAPKIEDLSEIAELFKEKTDDDNLDSNQIIKISTILKKMIKDFDPEATDDEINEIVLTYLNELLEALSKLLEKSFKVNDTKK